MEINKLFDANLDVGVHFGHCQHSDPGNSYFRLILTDKKSSLQFLELKIPRDQIANFFSNTIATGTCELRVVDILNKTRENKTVLVKVNKGVLNYYSDKSLKSIYDNAETLNPGWLAQRDEKFNWHMLDDDESSYKVFMERWT